MLLHTLICISKLYANNVQTKLLGGALVLVRWEEGLTEGNWDYLFLFHDESGLMDTSYNIQGVPENMVLHKNLHNLIAVYSNVYCIYHLYYWKESIRLDIECH